MIGSGYTATGLPSYGDTGFRRSLSYSSGFEVESTPDPTGRLASRTLQVPGGGAAFPAASYGWSGGVPRTRTTSVGGSASLDRTVSLDPWRRVAGITHEVAGVGSPFEDRSFTWSPGGNLLSREWTKQDETLGDVFQYDGFDRLVGSKLGVTQLMQSYTNTIANRELVDDLEPGQSRDKVTEVAGGSSTVTDYTNESNSPRYSAVGSIVPTYDGEGNLTYDGRFYYVYDFKNRLSEVWRVDAADSTSARTMSGAEGVNVPLQSLQSRRAEVCGRLSGELVEVIGTASRSERTSSAMTGVVSRPATRTSTTVQVQSTLVAAYGYDPFNRRIVRVVPEDGIDVRYAYDGWREVEELVPTAVGEAMVAVAQKVNVWGAGFGELVSFHRYDAGAAAWQSYLVAQDEQGSVTWVRDGSGVEVERVEYDPYGRRTVYATANGGVTYTAQSESSVGLDVGYTGHRHDAETGLVYARNRYLHVEWGRFLTLDPLGSWGDAANLGNGYAYVGNAATSATDPLGLYNVASGGGFGGGALSHGGSGGGAGQSDGGLTCGYPGSGADDGLDSVGGSVPIRRRIWCCRAEGATRMVHGDGEALARAAARYRREHGDPNPDAPGPEGYSRSDWVYTILATIGTSMSRGLGGRPPACGVDCSVRKARILTAALRGVNPAWDGDGDEVDAMRHCYLACSLGYHLGSLTARDILNFHERGAEPPGREQFRHMDNDNNRAGLSLAAVLPGKPGVAGVDEMCLAGCIAMLRRGELTVCER